MAVSLPAAVILSIGLCCVLATSAAENVTIADGETLKQYLCPSSGTLPPNTNLVLSKPRIKVYPFSSNTLCLIENTTNISITPSQEVLSGGYEFVTVECLMGQSTGFGFFNVTNLMMRSIMFYECGAAVSAEAVKYVNDTSQFLYYYKEDTFVSLFFNHCNDLKLYNVSIDNEILILLVGVNLCGTSEIISLVPDSYGNDVKYLFTPVLIYFTDSDLISPTLKCNFSLSSNTFSSRGGNMIDRFSPGMEKMPILYDYGDLMLFLTQSFVVNVTLNIRPRELAIPSNQYFDIDETPANIAVVFINSATWSHVTFQSFDLPYQFCLKEEDKFLPKRNVSHGFFELFVIFYETPSFSSEVKDIFSPMLITNTAFTKHYTVSQGHVCLLQIVKLSGTLSHEVKVENVSWCENDLDIRNLEMEFVSPLHAQNMVQDGSGQLYLKVRNVLMHHNVIAADESRHKRFNCLMCFTNIKEVAMTGTNYFADNVGGTVVNVVSSNLTISGNLTIKDGYAYRGGAISLDSTSTLYLKEPLVAEFYNNTADQGSAIYAPVRTYGEKQVSVIQIWPSKNYSLSDVASIDISLVFGNNSNGEIPWSIYAPHFSFFGRQTSANISFANNTWDSVRSQYAYTTLIDAILLMEERDKFTSLSNGLCIQLHEQEWNCAYIDQSFADVALSQCQSQVPYSMDIYPGQKALSVYYASNQVYDIGYCYFVLQGRHNVSRFKSYKFWNSSIIKENSMLSITFRYNPSFNDSRSGNYVALFTDEEVNLFSLPVLQLKRKDCPLGFCLSNGSCTCDEELKAHEYSCNIDSEGFSSKPGYWTGFSDIPYARILFDDNCPPNYCSSEISDFHLTDDPALSCLGDRTGILCGECKGNYSVVFGSDTCYNDCTDVYLLTLLVYALAGLLLVLLLFVLRLTVATGTINGVIFYANIFSLVMDKLTEHTSGPYVTFVRVFFSLLNLDLGFPLCLYEGMTTAGKVGFQFVFPVYLWSIVIGLVLIAKISTRVSKLVTTSSAQVLTTLFYLSFSKILRTVIVIFSYSNIHVINGCDDNDIKPVWYFDGNDYGHGTHAILLTLAVVFTLLFLLPYALFVTFSSCLLRFPVVNKLRNFVDAYGGPFKDRWRFWFGLRLWVTIFLFSLNGALEGTDSDVIFVVHSLVIVVFTVLQGFLRPFRNIFIGLLDASFMINYWLLIEVHVYSIFWGSYIFLTASSVLTTCGILLYHLCALKYHDRCVDIVQKLKYKANGYEAINNEELNADIIKAADDRDHNVGT